MTGGSARLRVDHWHYRIMSAESLFFDSTTLSLLSFDLDLPIDCDDEYWENEDPEKAWKQPSGKPSSMSYFIQFLKLGEVLGHVLRTIVRQTSGISAI